MVARPARDEDESTTSPYEVHVGYQTTEEDGVVIEVHAASHRVVARLRLLHDLFLHVCAVGSLRVD